MPRDNFSKTVIDRLAKRVGLKCSNPECRKPTSAPDSDDGVINLGVAAHIHAASPGGPRYDEEMTPDERSSISNGIWLCQNDAKLIDDDEIGHPATLLKEWKDTAEKIAALEARGFTIKKTQPFQRLEEKIPELVAEMREDLSNKPLTRQFILMSKSWSYGGSSTPYFAYFYETHPDLHAMVTIAEHFGAVYDITFNNVKRYNFSEEFVDYLIG